VIAEVALGLVLVTGAGLMINSFARLTRVDPGFRQDVITMETSLPRTRYGSESARLRAIEAVLENLRMTLGARHAGITEFRPLGSSMNVIARGAGAADSRTGADARIHRGRVL
jgi:putative ABC transport system permease protein